jgi:hypothetical protein
MYSSRYSEMVFAGFVVAAIGLALMGSVAPGG